MQLTVISSKTNPSKVTAYFNIAFWKHNYLSFHSPAYALNTAPFLVAQLDINGPKAVHAYNWSGQLYFDGQKSNDFYFSAENIFAYLVTENFDEKEGCG